MTNDNLDMSAIRELAGNVSGLKDKLSLIISSVDDLNETMSDLDVSGLGGGGESTFEKEETRVFISGISPEAISTIINAMSGGESSGEGGSTGGGKRGGKLSSLLGGKAAGIGIGVGAAGLGLGAAAGGLGYLISSIADFDIDGKKIKETVGELLSIRDLFKENDIGFWEAGVLAAALGALGGGLLAFSIGAGTAAVVEKFAGDILWTENVKSNVLSLLSIGDDAGGSLKVFSDGMVLSTVLGGLGAGLLAFSIGAGTAAVLEKFAGDILWSENVKSNVLELLSISKGAGGNWAMLKSGGTFFLAMTGIAAGLAVFGLGSAIAGIGSAIDIFTGKEFGKGVSDNVVSLLTIGDHLGGGSKQLGGKSGEFVLAMTGIGTGLAVFGLGSAIVGLSEGLNYFTNKEWAKGIVDNVVELLSISDVLDAKGNSFLGDSARFTLAMSGIALGLAAFGAGGIVSAFSEGVGKLFGGDSPMDKVLKITDRIDALERVGPAFRGMSVGINALGESFNKFDKHSGGATKKLTTLIDASESSQNLEKQTESNKLTEKAIQLVSNGMTNLQRIQQESAEAIIDAISGISMGGSPVPVGGGNNGTQIPMSRDASAYDKAYEMRSRYWTSYTRGL